MLKQERRARYSSAVSSHAKLSAVVDTDEECSAECDFKQTIPPARYPLHSRIGRTSRLNSFVHPAKR